MCVCVYTSVTIRTHVVIAGQNGCRLCAEWRTPEGYPCPVNKLVQSALRAMGPDITPAKAIKKCKEIYQTAAFMADYDAASGMSFLGDVRANRRARKNKPKWRETILSTLRSHKIMDKTHVLNAQMCPSFPNQPADGPFSFLNIPELHNSDIQKKLDEMIPDQALSKARRNARSLRAAAYA